MTRKKPPTPTVESPPEALPDQPPPPAEASRPPPTNKEVSPETRREIVRLRAFYGTRQIALRVGQSRKVVRRVLREEGVTSSPPTTEGPSLLTPFLHQIAERVTKNLTISRILREIREIGYRGGRTILATHIREYRTQHALALPRKKVKRRFETEAAREMQIDWSPYWVQMAGRPVLIHIMSVILCHCRKLSVAFYRDERQHTLLEALAHALEYFGGCAIDLVLDNMSTAVLGRLGPDRKPIWHPVFDQFVKHYGMNAIACTEGDPDRKGKDEKAFRLIKDDFLKGEEFTSWDDLMTRGATWLDGTPDTGNLRVHGTTGEVPNDAYLAERDYLIRLPRERFPVFEDSDRYVDNDATLSIHQRKYTIPAFLANRTVRVRLYAHFFEVLDPDGRIAFSRTYAGPEEKRRLLIERTHYAGLPRRPRDAGHRQRLDESFVRRFPDLASLVDGLKLRMKTLAHIHIRQLLRLADRYGQEAFLAAARRAQEFRRFDAGAVAKILEEDHPDQPTDPVVPLTGHGAVVLGEVDPGSLDGFGHLDEDPPTRTDDTHDAGDTDDGAPDADTSPDSDPEGGDPHGS